jgi:TusA-related sulfurtransferase
MNSDEFTVDVQGLACPIPVMRVMKALSNRNQGRVVVLLDDPVARENVSRLATHLGFAWQCESCPGGFRITIEKPAPPGTPS